MHVHIHKIYTHIRTLYKPVKPNSLMTPTAPVLAPSLISQATCTSDLDNLQWISEDHLTGFSLIW